MKKASLLILLFTYLTSAAQWNSTINSPANLPPSNNSTGGTLNRAYTPSVRMMIKSNGNVGIGTEDPKYLLAVNGTIGAKKVKVTQDNWPDYVFYHNYKLPSLKEVKVFIKTYGHLPEVPSAKEVGKDGVDIGDTQAMLLKKIEEITLYMIGLKEENEKLAQRISELEKRK